jgi:putative membrane protein
VSTAPPTLGRLLGTWSLDGVVVAALGAATVLYWLGVVRQRRRWPISRTCSFIAGLFVLALALMSGFDRYAEELLSVHMAQHLLLSLLAPTLLLLGAPVRLALSSSPPRARAALGAALASRVVQSVSRPAAGLMAFTVVMLATHLTGLFELALESQTVHACEHAAYFWSGVLLLAPLIGADPLPHPPGPLARFSWLLGAMSVMAIPGVLLSFATSVRYPFYLAPARALGRSALTDEHLAGVIMWVGGGVLTFALAVTVAMHAMLAEERRQQRRERYSERPTGGGRGSPGAIGL